jgi:hypothetical protein
MKQKSIWGIFFFVFIALSSVAITQFIHANECNFPNEVPTISSSLFQQYYQGVTIVLFILAAFSFRSGHEKLFIIALILFAIAFFRDDNGVHIAVIISGTGIMWIALIWLFYRSFRNQNGDNEPDYTWIFVTMFLLSFICGFVFFYLYFTDWGTYKVIEKSELVGEPNRIIWRKNPCSYIAWWEYAAFTLLFASTFVLVPDDDFDVEDRTRRDESERRQEAQKLIQL